jgi:uncharacterized membrane protein
VATAVAALAYSFLALRRVFELRANAFDAGFIDNVLYKVSSGLGDVSGLTGVPHFIDHASALLLLAIPVYWLNADLAYDVLLILQAISVAMVGFAAWLIADSIGLSRGHRGAVLLYVLVSPAAYWAIITELHLTGLSMGLVAMMIAGAFRRWRISAYWILPVLASLARVEIALTVVVAGFLLLGVSRVHARVAIIFGVSIGGLLAMFMILAPDQGSSVGAHFDYLGIDSFSQIPAAMVQQPGEVLRQLLNPIFVASVVMWLITIGLVLPLRAPRWFLVGVPMLVVAAIGSPTYADLWYQHYWNFLLVGAAVAFALSLKIWSWSSGMANTLVVVALVVAWIIPGSLILRPQLIDPFYPPASAAAQEAAARSSSAVGAVSTMSKLVPPGAHREWIYNFPNPFVCHADQYAYFKLSGPAPDVVITKSGWGEMVDPSDIASLRNTLATDYRITDRFGTYTVRERIPGASPRLVTECRVVEAAE